ncbi:macrophage infectivity potentiator (MIP) [Cryptosporidium ryanae]|uniref:macrophage infectivity potentiator (MIP) n=1 Tax=Cryptosporidium ryanae TaxID=515981 RepID=UPI00351A02F6|nr:macrophage infectivity potentiator (MIP) [Cryptosporidium ryanae]
MTKFLSTLLVLFCVIKTFASCSKLEWTGSEFEVKSLIDFSPVFFKERSLNCESCQLIVFALKEYINKELDIYKNSSPPKGFIDITLSNFLESHVACSNHVWQPLADNSLTFTIENFISSCRENLSAWEPSLESYIDGKMSLKDGIKYVCVENNYCGMDEAWDEKEYPNNREPKAELLKKRSQEFIDKNKNAEGVITTDSGLQYKILKKGDGKINPSADDEVEVQYRGKTLGGVEFDSSFNRGDKPAKMTVSQLIPAWVEALSIMNEGDEVILFVPPELAYGERGVGDSIGPNEVIVFKLRLVKILSSKQKTESSSEQDEETTDKSDEL